MVSSGETIGRAHLRLMRRGLAGPDCGPVCEQVITLLLEGMCIDRKLSRFKTVKQDGQILLVGPGSPRAVACNRCYLEPRMGRKPFRDNDTVAQYAKSSGVAHEVGANYRRIDLSAYAYRPA